MKILVPKKRGRGTLAVVEWVDEISLENVDFSLTKRSLFSTVYDQDHIRVVRFPLVAGVSMRVQLDIAYKRTIFGCVSDHTSITCIYKLYEVM